MKTFLQSTTPEALLFDIDNTLYQNDSYVASQIEGQIFCLAREWKSSRTEAERRVNIARRELERVEGRRPSLAKTLISLGVPLAKSIAWRTEQIRPEDYLVSDPQLRLHLLSLREHYRLAAVTNNPVIVGERTLRQLGIEDLFESVTGLDSSGECKPGWGPFEHALQGMNLSAPAVVMVGDRYDVDLEPVILRGGGAILVEQREDLLEIRRILEETYALSSRA